MVSSAGAMIERIDLTFEFDMHYVGQTHTVAVPVPVILQDGTTGITSAVIKSAFETAYAASFSRLLSGLPIRIVSLRSAGYRPPPGAGPFGLRAGAGKPRSKRRNGVRVRYGSRAPGSTPGYGRGSIYRSARSLKRPPFWNSPTRRSTSNRACAVGSINWEISSLNGSPNDGVIRAPAARPPERFSAFERRLWSCWPEQSGYRGAAGQAQAAHRSVAQGRRPDRRDLVYPGAGQGRRADDFATSEDAATVPGQGRFRTGQLGSGAGR